MLKVALKSALACLAACTALAWAQPARADFIYGIGDDNIIYQVETDSQTIAPIFNTGLSGSSNAFAYDPIRKQFFFIDSARNLRFWDGGPSLFSVAGAGSGVIGSGQPANAVYYNNSYWYFTERSNTLNQIPLNYAVPTAPTADAKSTFSIAGITNPSTNTFGDIAVDGSGILYGATTGGTFFSIDLANPTTSYTVIKPTLANPGTNPSLQLSFSADFSRLFGQDFVGGQWYDINRSTGLATPLSGFATPIASNGNALRDLGGAGAVPIQTPGPLPLAGVTFSVLWSRRLRARIRQGRPHA
ncbi:hypothetical protein KQ306_00820 [Synechococcus sp. CS-1324]|uniref:hypothetical protein n=1 Tax=Synechococcus sp. CS-1324 TaxID=2847980 RepID=UPI00223C25C5|nr:hypothetical protein [Synechococcus sp. CS-1324]MCT0229406.1 hypothetical protein [Synechococcus sp. CS-1324]